MNLTEMARMLMLHNFQKTGGRYICPSFPHYKHQWLWDSCFHAIVCTNIGLKDLAKNEIEKLIEHQRADGSIPHKIYYEYSGYRDWGRQLYKRFPILFPQITQPPVLAQAIEEINDIEWAQTLIDKVIQLYLYFKEKHDPDNDYLISVCHPDESGCDASPDLDFSYWTPSRMKLVNFFVRTISVINLQRKYQGVGWKIPNIWRQNGCDAEYVMLQCIWIDGLRSLIRILRALNRTQQAQELAVLADRSQHALLTLCWDEKEKIFWPLNSKNKQMKTHETVSSLFPIILDEIPQHMISAIVDRIANPKKFGTSYPLPWVSISDPAFDLKTKWLLWRGPIWINAVWFIARGLRKHGYDELAQTIADRTQEMAEKEGFREFYNPFTGKGMGVKNFGWSALAALL